MYKEIVGQKVTLKLLEPKYFDEYHNMFSSVVRVILGLPETSTVEETRCFLLKIFEGLKNSENSKYKVFYCIFDNEDKKLIGALEIREPGCKDGQLGTWINENYWGYGRYQEVLNLCLEAYFRSNDIGVINAYVRASNIRSLKAHQKYGFEIVGESKVNGNDCYEIVVSRDKVLNI